MPTDSLSSGAPQNLASSRLPQPCGTSQPSCGEAAPAVSIIVPCFNHALFLAERMDTILNQSFQDFEIILLDDASSDGSSDILRRYEANPKVSSLIINRENSGSPFRQWQKGISIAKGKYIWIAESDDAAASDLLKRCVDALEQNPAGVLVFTGSEYIDSDSRPVVPPADYDRWAESPSFVPDRIVFFDGKEYLSRVLVWECRIYNASGVLFRREAVSGDMLSQSAAMRNAGDWLFWIKLASKGKVGRIYSRLNRMRLHGVNTTTQGNSSGRRWAEDARVIHYAASRLPFPRIWKKAREGAFIYHLLNYGEIEDSIREGVVAEACAVFGMSPGEALRWRRLYLKLRRHPKVSRFLGLTSLPPLQLQPM